MSEAEILEAVGQYSDIVISTTALYSSILFAYLATAYFVGKELSRFQVQVISGMFVAISGLLIIVCVSLVHAWMEILTKGGPITALEMVPFFRFQGWHYLSGILLSAGAIAALYFMFDIRRANNEN